MIDAYPLHWPHDRPRTPSWKRERSRFEVTFARARDDVLDEVHRLLAVSRRWSTLQIVISTNVPLRRDGLPLAGQKKPVDPGVAVYFTRKGRPVCFACDRWELVEENMRAIAKTIEAIRGIDRWGSGHAVDAVFTGFVALPRTTPGWWEVLGVPRDAPAYEITEAYRRLASLHHPDKGGSHEKMAAINAAMQAMTKERGG